MKIVYLVQVHKEAEQIKNLVDLLSGGDNHCFVHVDAKSDRLFHTLSRVYSDISNVHIIAERIDVHWSGFSQVEATLALLQALWDVKIDFDRIQLMSGEDLPVKRLDEVEKFLTHNADKEYLEYAEIGKMRWRVKRYNLLTESNHNRTLAVRAIQKIVRIAQVFIPERDILEGYKLYKGSSWFNLSREAVVYIRHFLDRNPTFPDAFRYSACADEHFFQILLLNSPLADRIVNDNLYYMEWTERKASPDYLSPDLFDGSSPAEHILFARKFDRRTARILTERIHTHEA